MGRMVVGGRDWDYMHSNVWALLGKQAVAHQILTSILREGKNSVTRSSKTERLLQAKRLYSEKPLLRRESTWRSVGGIAGVVMLASSPVAKFVARSEDEAAKVQAEMVEFCWDDATELNGIAWGIAAGREENRNLELALKAAQRGSELREHKDAAILDSLARVYYEMGQLDDAIEWQRRAVEQDPRHRVIVNTLVKYETERQRCSIRTTRNARRNWTGSRS